MCEIAAGRGRPGWSRRGSVPPGRTVRPAGRRRPLPDAMAAQRGPHDRWANRQRTADPSDAGRRQLLAEPRWVVELRWSPMPPTPGGPGRDVTPDVLGDDPLGHPVEGHAELLGDRGDRHPVAVRANAVSTSRAGGRVQVVPPSGCTTQHRHRVGSPHPEMTLAVVPSVRLSGADRLPVARSSRRRHADHTSSMGGGFPAAARACACVTTRPPTEPIRPLGEISWVTVWPRPSPR